MDQAVRIEPNDDPDPQNWRLHVDQRCIDLYRSVHDNPRPLTAEECAQLVELVDAWRSHEIRKHNALMAALAKVAGETRQ